MVKFGVITDVHLDIMHDGEWRLRSFLQAARDEDVDFIIQLGDMRYPDVLAPPLCREENTPVNLRNALATPSPVNKAAAVALFNGFEKPRYHVLGNHDLDFATKTEAMALVGMQRPYYSFNCGGWHFVVLDTNFYRAPGGGLVDYDRGNYYDSADLPYLPPEQLAWLEQDLLAAGMPTVLFSHQPMAGEERSLRNQPQLAAVLRRVSAHSPVRLCLNGHLHKDVLHQRDGVYYLTVNSASSFWMGAGYSQQRYGNEIEAAYPNLRHTAPYAQPLYAFVALGGAQGEISIRGVPGTFVPPPPPCAGAPEGPTPAIQNRRLVFAP